MDEANTDPMADDNKYNDEDREESEDEDQNYEDKEDEGLQDDGEYGAGDELPEDHFKMSAFQVTIKKVLERQIEKLNLEVKEAARLVSIGGKESEEAAKNLHDEQKFLVLEEDNVRVTTGKLEKTQSKREKREKQNRDYRVELEAVEADIEARVVHNEELRAEVNDLTGQSLHHRLQRLDMENQVGVDQACSDKGEQDFKVAQEAKQVQDKYIGQSGVLSLNHYTHLNISRPAF